MSCVSPHFPLSTPSPLHELHEVNRKSIREVDSDFLCEFCVFFLHKKSFKENLNTHTCVRLGDFFPTRPCLMMLLAAGGEVGLSGRQMCV